MQLLRGPVGSSVELLLHRQDGRRSFVTLVRAPTPRPPEAQLVAQSLPLKTNNEQPHERDPKVSFLEQQQKKAPHHGVGVGLAENRAGELYIAKLMSGGAAAASGSLELGDVLQAVQGRPVAGLSKSEVCDRSTTLPALV